MNKISMVKYHQLNAAIRTIRDFCNSICEDCTDCPFWKDTMNLQAIGSKDCMFNDRIPEDWEELPKEVLDKE